MRVTITTARTARTEWFRMPTTWQPLAAHLRSLPKPATIYCGAVATGEEAFTVAILLEHLGIPGHVTATDIDPELIALARAPRFTGEEIAQALVWANVGGVMTPDQVMQHFQKDGNEWCPTEAVRARVSLSIADLCVDEIPPADVVFVRNVWRHLEVDGRTHLAGQLRQRLVPGALLAVGGADLVDERGRPTGFTDKLQGFTYTGVGGIYRRD